ncbi:MAG: HAMP domain-containing sensor histidine kinase [Planctomycetota bacterium]
MKARRPLLSYALLLVVPAVLLGGFGFYSVAREDRARRDDARRHAAAEVRRLVDEEAAELDAVRAREAARPYFQYAPQYMPADAVVANGPAFVRSPLASPSDDPRVLGWFQWTLSQGVVSGPEVFPGDDVPWRATLVDGFGPALRGILERAPRDPGVATAPTVKVPVQTLMANEERGQLLEEVQVAAESNRATNYLENFQKRQAAGPQVAVTPTPEAAGAPAAPSAAPASRPPPAAADVVAVPVTPFGYLLRDAGVPGAVDVVAWRVVWIPGAAAASRRSAPQDRWLLQGYVVDAGRSFPAEFTPVGGDVVVARGTAPSPMDLPDPLTVKNMMTFVDRYRGVAVASLLDRLVGSPDPRPASPDPRAGPSAIWPGLFVLGEPAEAALDAERDASLVRYALLVAGLLAVTGIGLFVVARTVRREMEVAERKQDFVAAVTHELKTPLASIRMYADMLKEGWVPEGETPEDYAERIVGETKRLSSLVDQVLELAALDRGTATVTAVAGDLGACVRDAVALCAPAASAAGVPVAVDVAPGLASPRFDPGLVRALVVNLVDNAVKYSAHAPEKDVRVAVRAGAGSVDVVVADRGPGIPVAEQGRLFQAFSRGGREDTRTARGVGLGLALVRRYADAHRAKVVLDSAPGRGTTVTVRFPV